MNNFFKSFFILFFIGIFSTYSHHHGEESAAVLNLNVLKKQNTETTYLIKYLKSTRLINDGLAKLDIGLRYRLHPNFKVGAFYVEEWGVFNKTSLKLETSPRFQLGFLPGENWVLKLGNALLYNSKGGQAELYLYPSLTYFFFKDGNPFINLSLRYEYFRELNKKSVHPNYLSTSYINFLYHFSEMTKISLGYSYYEAAKASYTLYHMGFSFIL